jgi:hypothetical protein
MGRRLRARFPSISAQKYLPSRFPIQSTQVGRLCRPPRLQHYTAKQQ